MKKYNPKSLEAKWQKYWQVHKTFAAKDVGKKKKKFVLVEFPYPSGAGLHMGHMRGYTAGDVTSRYFRLRGEEVLFPIGWDAFGLPAENYAIKTGVHPKKSTAKNVANFVKQINSLGYSFDWDRVVDTTDPKYYKWTQWIFLQLFLAGLAYESTAPINWCPKDKTGLANEEVINGACERCGTPVEKKELRQWYLKITAYAEKLLAGLRELPEWPEQVKLQQENWIGKSTGAEIEFAVKGSTELVKVFTTRPDTLFGATYLVLAPEHPLIAKLADKITNYAEVTRYVTATQKEDEIKRTDATREKTGILLAGIEVVNPATKETLPVWVADYVLGHYGTGAIMAVPAHDERDFAFARKFQLPVRQVVAPAVVDHRNPPRAGKKNTERDVVLVVLFDPKQNKYLVLSWNKQPWKTFITGGVEAGESVEDAALREVKEETGYSKVRFSRVLGVSQSQFFAAHKDVNRTARVTSVLCVLEGAARTPRSAAEVAAYDLLWLTKEEVVRADLQHAEFAYVWERLEADVPYIGAGVLVNSGRFDGQESETVLPKMAREFGAPKVQYKLRDWVFSRQRYWGEPIPIVHCASCAVKKLGNKSKAEVYFSDQKIWASLLRGDKTVETRSFDPKGENAAWAKIAPGDSVRLYNKKTKQHAVADVLETRTFKNFLELYKAGDWLAGVFPGQTFKSPIALELAYKKIYRGYPEQVRRYGLIAWKIAVRTTPVPLREKDLPLKLPPVKKYEPTGTGESPLAQVSTWVNTTCPACKAPARRETNTMPQWAGSSWYWLRYTDPRNGKEFASKTKLRRWTPVDIYFGGMEHTTLHLLYSRFWNQFLFDKKFVTAKEPYAKRVPHGIILAADGEKMSKSRGNVVNPDDIVKKHGADAARMYELFLGPHDAQVAWSDQGVIGVRRFLDRVWNWGQTVSAQPKGTKDSEQLERLLHKLIKKVGEDIEAQRFNTCVSSLMEFLNEAKDETISVASFGKLLVVLYPFAPHIAEELHATLGGRTSLQGTSWPKFDPGKAFDATVEFVVQVNGKLRDKLRLPAGTAEAEAKAAALASTTVQVAIGGATVRRIIFVPNKLLNIVV